MQVVTGSFSNGFLKIPNGITNLSFSAPTHSNLGFGSKTRSSLRASAWGLVANVLFETTHVCLQEFYKLGYLWQWFEPFKVGPTFAQNDISHNKL